jgi:GTP cyclohydrolase II
VTYSAVNTIFNPTAGLIEVERAIFEIRAGRPVVLRHAGARLYALAAEALDSERSAELDAFACGSAGLALAAPRLRRLGLAARNETGVVALPKIDPRRLRALVLDADARIDAPAAPASPTQAGALELLRLAQTLSAAITFPIDADDARVATLLSVALDDVLAYAKAKSAHLAIVARAPVPLDGAPDTEFVVFRGGEGLRDQLAAIIGRPDFAQPVAIRLHSACLTGDLFGSLKCDCGDQLRNAARFMAENGGGVLLYLDQEGRGNGLANKIRAYDLQAHGFDTYDADAALGFGPDQRRFEFAASMLRRLGATRVRVMTNNPQKIAALEAAGLVVVSDHRLLGRETSQNIRYLAAKRDKAGHLLEIDSEFA